MPASFQNDGANVFYKATVSHMPCGNLWNCKCDWEETDKELGNEIKAINNYFFIRHYKDQSIGAREN